jgi:hypothetical protein
MKKSEMFDMAMSRLDIMGYTYGLGISRDRITVSWNGHGELWHTVARYTGGLRWTLNQIGDTVLHWCEARSRHNGQEDMYAVLDDSKRMA